MRDSEWIFEVIKTTDEQAVEALRAGDKTQFDQWISQLEAELDTIYEAAGSTGLANAQVEYAIRRAVVYYKAGRTGEAISDVREIFDATRSPFFDGLSVVNMASSLLESMEKGETLE